MNFPRNYLLIVFRAKPEVIVKKKTKQTKTENAVSKIILNMTS